MESYTLSAPTAMEWYASLVKPDWAPPGVVFGPVWTVLYVIILVSFGYVAWLFWRKKIPRRVFLPFALNIACNLAFSPIQFGLQNNLLASLDILLVLGTLVWAMRAIRPYASWVVSANLPYLLWVAFATVLQLTITWLNAGAGNAGLKNAGVQLYNRDMSMLLIVVVGLVVLGVAAYFIAREDNT